MSLINKLTFLFLYLFVFSSANVEGYVKAGDNLIWDSEIKATPLMEMQFKNDKFIAFADKMIANYEERNNDEIFTKIELFKMLL